MVVFTILVSQAARTKTAASRQKRNFIKSERVNLLQKQSSFGILEPQSIDLGQDSGTVEKFVDFPVS